jgi:putative ABC transport system permease protein
LKATARRSPFIETAETDGIAVDASDRQLLATLDAKIAAGRFLDRANERYPLVVLGAIAAQRLGVRAARLAPAAALRSV